MRVTKRGIGTSKDFTLVYGRGICINADGNSAYIRTSAFGLLCWNCYKNTFPEQLELFD